MAKRTESKITKGLRQMLVHATCDHRWQPLGRRKRLHKRLCVGRYCPRCLVTEYHYGPT